METWTRHYSLFFAVSVTHQRLGGEVCSYISLAPSDDCLILLAHHRLICKQQDGELQVIMEANGKTATTGRSRNKAPVNTPVNPAPDHYRFLIRVEDPAFFAVTRLDLTDYPAQLFCFGNTVKNKPLSVKKIQNPGRNREAVLGMVDISLSGAPADIGAQAPFLLAFEAV
jgi:hypothetical protein